MLIVSLITSVNFFDKVFVISLKSQFDRVIGLQFFKDFGSLPSFGISLRYDDLWEWGKTPLFNE